MSGRLIAIGLCALLAGACQRGATRSAACLPDVQLTDLHGKNFSLGSLRGQPTLVNVIHTSCPEICTALTDKFISVANKLGPDLGGKVSLLSLTNDPQTDRPAELLRLAQSRKADHAGWVFATGEVGNVEAVLRSLGVTLERRPDGEAAHVTQVFLIGADGCIKKEYDGMSMSAPAVVADLVQTIEGRS
ncbi:MAG: SCO family protein [Candidatus Binataceae bacterium]